jgi:hypothetical protein
MMLFGRSRLLAVACVRADAERAYGSDEQNGAARADCSFRPGMRECGCAVLLVSSSGSVPVVTADRSFAARRAIRPDGRFDDRQTKSSS